MARLRSSQNFSGSTSLNPIILKVHFSICYINLLRVNDKTFRCHQNPTGWPNHMSTRNSFGGYLADRPICNAQMHFSIVLRIVGKIYTQNFSFFGKENSISWFESWDWSNIKDFIILHSRNSEIAIFDLSFTKNIDFTVCTW